MIVNYKQLIKKVINNLNKNNVDYADIRITETIEEYILCKNCKLEDIKNSKKKEIGIRVIKNGNLGFACTYSEEKIEETALKAFNLAERCNTLSGNKIRLATNNISYIEGNYKTPIKIDPFKVDMKEKIKLLLEAQNKIREYNNNCESEGFMKFRKQKKELYNNRDTYIKQEFYEAGCGLRAIINSNNDIQLRSYPYSSNGNFSAKGYEYILDLNLIENAEIIAKEVTKLIYAEDCPKGIYDVLIDSSQVAMLIHETIGHTVELDRIRGFESDYTGGSFLKEEDVKKAFKFASNCVNVISDPTLQYGLGTFLYDDDGIKANKFLILENGILKNLISSNFVSNNNISGCGSRADCGNDIPLVRMSNVNLLPGDFTKEDIIRDIKYGLYLHTYKSCSIDFNRENFQFSCEIAYEIRNGQLTGRVFKNVVYGGKTIKFWKSCKGICNNEYFELYGIDNCGKGNPIQVIHCTHGSSPAKFKGIKVGMF